VEIVEGKIEVERDHVEAVQPEAGALTGNVANAAAMNAALSGKEQQRMPVDDRAPDRAPFSRALAQDLVKRQHSTILCTLDFEDGGWRGRQVCRNGPRSSRPVGFNVTLVDPVPAIMPPQHDAVQQLSGDRPARDNDPPEVPGPGPGGPVPLSHDIGVCAIVRRGHVRDPGLKPNQRQTDERDHAHRYADADRGHRVQQNPQNEFWHGGPRQNGPSRRHRRAGFHRHWAGRSSLPSRHADPFSQASQRHSRVKLDVAAREFPHTMRGIGIYHQEQHRARRSRRAPRSQNVTGRLA
jgi:hypothetical protein